MITITQKDGEYRAEYSAPEAPGECAEDFFEVEYGDTDLTAAINVRDADAVWSACAKLRTCNNCKYGNKCETQDVLLSILYELPSYGCNAWERT